MQIDSGFVDRRVAQEVSDGGAGGKVTEDIIVGLVVEMAVVGSTVRLHTAPAVSKEAAQCPLQFSSLQHGALGYTLHCLCPV